MNRWAFVLPLVVASTAVACGGKTLFEEYTVPSDASVPPDEDSALPPFRIDAGVDGNAPPGDASSLPGFDGGPTEPLSVLDLGAVSAGVPVTFAVPPNTLGFHVIVESDRPSESLAVMDVLSPNGGFVHKDAKPFGGVHPTSETLFGSTAAVQIPQSQHPDVMPTVVPGNWQVTFRGAGTLRAKVQLQSTPDGEFHGGALELDVYLPSGLRLGGPTAITPANAATNPEVVGRMRSFFANVFALYGLRNGPVRFYAIPSRFTTIEDSELDSLFQETRVAGRAQSLHVFLSEGDDSSEWWGIAAGIPGAANAPGNEQSGLALASIPEANAEIEGVVLAHEAGHFFGLNHTTEISGDPDPLTDTPVCTNINAGNLDACPDVSNVMFAAGALLGPPTSSPAQRRVVQGSPIFKAFRATPPNGIRRVPPMPALDYGKLFGHPGRPLQPAEKLALFGACGHPNHARPTLSAETRSALERLALDPRVAPRMRKAARRVLVR